MVSEEKLLGDAISRLLGGEHDPDAGRELPLHIVPAARGCTKIIYTTKIDWLARLTDGLTNVPAEVAILWRYGPLSPQYQAVVRAVAQSLDAPIYFVGDLDPLDLVTYATLAAPGESPLMAIGYLGISDGWLERCERDLALRPGMAMQAVCIPMEPEEQNALARLKQLPPPWADPLGPRATSLLSAGLKLELEGASNPDLYSRAFCDDLVRSLFR
jgi:hypothetical protein